LRERVVSLNIFAAAAAGASKIHSSEGNNSAAGTPALLLRQKKIAMTRSTATVVLLSWRKTARR